MKFKNHTALLLTSIIALNAAPAFAVSPTVQAIGYKSCGAFPESMGFGEKPQYCMNHEGKTSVSFMVSGENIVSVKKETLKANTLTLNGADISTNRTGDPTYALGSFPKTSEDGTKLVFDVEIKNAPFAKNQKIAFDGTVDITTSEKMINLSHATDLTKEFEVKLGDYTITNKKKLSIEGAIGSAMTSMMSSGDSLPIKIAGDLDALISLEMFEGDKKVDTGWSSWNDGIKTINFNKPSQTNVNFKLKYWDKLTQKTVKLSF